MRRVGAALVAIAAVLAGTGAAGPVGPQVGYRAEEPHVQRGVDGCFAWSWGDDWLWEATVYFHNRCDQPHYLKISWKSNAVRTSVITVPANGKGRHSRMSDPLKIYDGGRP